MGKITIILAGGKTGGHLFPGIALAEILRKRGVEVIFAGTRGGLEESVVPEKGFLLEFIKAGGLKGKSFGETVNNLMILPQGLVKSLAIIKKYKADAVVSLGGYAAGPVSLAARLLNKKIFVLEQNSIPGITNRMVGKFADKIYLSFPDEKQRFDSKKCLLTGNPVRKEVIDSPKKEFNTSKTVLGIFGGSQGASSLNNLIMYTLTKYPDLAKTFYFVHQTGDRDYQEVRDFYEKCRADFTVERFVQDIGSYYKAIDLIVCRAGATTIAELIALKKPAIYVPFPHAADNHQYYNAVFVAQKGGGIVVEDNASDTNKGKKLYQILAEITADKEAFNKKMDNFPLNNAAERIAGDIIKILGG